MNKIWLLLTAAALALAGCVENSQSALDPAGIEARQIARMSWMLFGFGTLVFLIVMAATAIALSGPPQLRRRLASRRTIIGLGLVFPTVTLFGLFIGITSSARGLMADASTKADIKVTGEQWWWRVRYTTHNGATVESANEVRIPVGQPVIFELSSADVIHSFWIPALGGKIDMIPGRTTRLKLTAERAGIYRGQCAEYCGGPHALMAFKVVAMDPDDHAAWLARQRQPAVPGASEADKSGAALFLAAGCGACHTIDGTAAKGQIGPNLSRLGSRISVGIDQNPVSRANIVHFLVAGQSIKPRNHMPEFDFLSTDQRNAIAQYLLELK
jgi:cytochrome c oxidase subunit 2